MRNRLNNDKWDINDYKELFELERENNERWRHNYQLLADKHIESKKEILELMREIDELKTVVTSYQMLIQVEGEKGCT